MIIDAGPWIVDGENVNSRLWALIKRCLERGEEIHTTHPVMAQVWRSPHPQANVARAIRLLDVHPMADSIEVGRRLAETDASDVVDAHLVVTAERLGTFVVSTDTEDMQRLGARFEMY